MKKVRKAIIPAAGLGTRFLPATKAMPKEMLPIVDKPTIQYIVEEAIQSGIEDIIIVTGKTKRSIEDHFDNAFELEQNLLEKKKYELLEKVQASSKMVDIHYIRQKEPRGLGHAVWCARKFIGDEPFAVLLGDDIVQAEKPCLRQLMDEYDKTLSSVIGVQTVPEDETHRYGIIDPLEQEGRRYQVRNFVEKPAAGTAPSNLAIMGRYVLTPEIFMFLEQQNVGAGGEIQLTDAIQNLNEIQRVFAYDFEGKRYDVGEKLGFVQTTIEMALQHPELRGDMVTMMKRILEEQTNQES
ncbi:MULTISPECIES: UTP--glucose-1-phosphate uridylyltransferase GalU [Bacillus]|jgi:UTP--glucose-1-phosphate uridylyltransferase|uniref:UTP--glucose-1-phosphate uridylyltransferase n=1 Tax=Bacillus toyonensis TaxID=155322 RepID=A0A2B6TF99_9BACI|nr:MULTISPECIES: UTP--glucose-1-phosphate uridylyltransferase GalU [Bacillus]AFU15609.1 UTP--glucose-1-phosphate uridylyltransferase [Bacillus thuringiensis MC28]EEL58941.1 Superoxide dismutase [Bacillus cereus Rock4-18]OFC96208.1 UTP--glucose-1-phosphate uridylyltransferase GtaB [Bacillus thuringiensis]OTW92106.1 UTP--glucose-1-phosphate uridylyltransferase [Bacillus thuringiensis serovar cameroun]OTX03645.1 UTP--glucose-1-phosphate uridylyltransferase [Bacillus thuringiensis serovar seoulens